MDMNLHKIYIKLHSQNGPKSVVQTKNYIPNIPHYTVLQYTYNPIHNYQYYRYFQNYPQLHVSRYNVVQSPITRCIPSER